MLQYKEFSAWIVIEGEEAQEFNVEASEDEKKVSCWIPSEVGKVRCCIIISVSEHIY